MRKVLAIGLASALALCGTGCVIVAKNKGTLLGPCVARQAVAIDGSIYVVDVCTGEVSKVEGKAVAEAKTFVPKNDCQTEIILNDD
jgi:hypothetical protein